MYVAILVIFYRSMNIHEENKEKGKESEGKDNG